MIHIEEYYPNIESIRSVIQSCGHISPGVSTDMVQRWRDKLIEYFPLFQVQISIDSQDNNIFFVRIGQYSFRIYIS